ncbi:IclR family transcriptional regulator [Glaciimonas sp. PCH181]|uniref:IclR family transcriptional regulator n=1 Tax=Glaciimonas sp. PCH181 TaxID=2133943 RepID=UPI000D38465B|nr:IclR family transcriptional regulator C-terminal domain-containing protein [Glaciimonas sp. PCH181]PUA16371.1 IclR family transcriptional regulator [Glaciimonas sp. PCH181]
MSADAGKVVGTRKKKADKEPALAKARAAPNAESIIASATESPLYVNSVEKGMRVLMAFDGQQRQLSLSQIAALTGFDLSAAQRFTYTLTVLGYLNKDEESRKYELSPKLLDFAYHYLSSSELVTRATPYLQQLSQETEETTNLTILEGTDVVFVQRIVSRHVLNPTVVTGTRIPAYCTASGLALLSTMGDGEVDVILAASELRQHTPFTIVDPKKIKQRLATFREQGYAHIKEEYFLGDVSTAAAVKDARGRGIGAVNVAVTKARWGADSDESRYASLVMSAARAISLQRK